MEAEELVALEQVVISAESKPAPIESKTAATTQGEADGQQAGGKRRWQHRKRPSASSVQELVSQGEMHAAKQQQSLSSLQLPGADGRLVNDFSDLGSDMRSRKSDAKSPRSSQGRSSKRKVGKSKRKKEGEERGEEYEIEGLEGDEGKQEEKKFYEKRSFWTFRVPLVWMLLFVFIGIMLRIYRPLSSTSNVQLWRFFLFLGCLPLIYVASNYILLAAVWFFESQFFTTTNVLYFVIALKSPARYVLMSLLLLPLYIPLFAPEAHLSHGASTAYNRVLEFIASVIVFTAMNFLKVLFAKLLSTYFHSSTHFVKMQEALDKEFFLKALSTPRQDGSKFVDMLGPEGGEEHFERRRSLDRRASAIGKTAPGRLVSKLVAPLMKVPLVKGRASSLPSPTTLDHLTEGTAAALQAEKQSTPQPPPLTNLPMLPDDADPEPQAPALQQPLEPPDQRDGEPGDRQSRALQSQQRRNSDGGAGLAGILQNLEPSPGDRALLHEGGLPVQDAAQLRSDAVANDLLRSQSSHAADEDNGRRMGRQDKRSQWAKRRQLERTPSGKAPVAEPDSHEGLPVTAEEMTNEQGIALVATINQVEKHLRKRQMNVPFTQQLEGAEAATEQEARKLAFFIFWNVKPFFDRKYILQSDLEGFLSKRRAAEAFHILDRDGDGQVSLAELRSSITEIFNERANLAMQLRDTKTVVGTLEVVFGIALHIIALFFYLMIFGVNIQHVWVLFTSIFLGFAFIFGNSIKNLFEAVLFLFVTHAFDVGDILILDTNDRVKVEEISLSSIIMRRGDGVRLWVPTTQLVLKTCQNISRSDNRGDGFKFLVDLGISAAALQELDRQVGVFIESRDTDFSAGHSVQLAASGDPLKVALNVGFEFSHNGVDIAKMSQARSDLLQVVSDALTELGIVYTQAALRPYKE